MHVVEVCNPTPNAQPPIQPAANLVGQRVWAGPKPQHLHSRTVKVSLQQELREMVVLDAALSLVDDTRHGVGAPCHHPHHPILGEMLELKAHTPGDARRSIFQLQILGHGETKNTWNSRII